MSKFDPKSHMTNLKGKDYLEVKWRIVWFKDENPNGSIQTEIVNYQPLVARAVVFNNDGVLVATGHGSANLNGKSAVWAGREVEKAETAAIGRALAHAGYGTQFDPDSDEDDYLADSPIQRVGGTNQTAQNSHQTRQDAILDELPRAAGDFEQSRQNGAKTGAERLGTPNGQRIGQDTVKGVEVIAVRATVKNTKNNKPYLLLESDSGQKVSLFTRDPLREAGYDCEGWTEMDKTYVIDPPAAVTAKQDGKFLNFESLIKADSAIVPF